MCCVLRYAKSAFGNAPWSYDQQKDRKRGGKKPRKKGPACGVPRNCPADSAGYDIVLVARTKTTVIKSTALTPILTAQLRKLGALQSKEKE